MFATTLVPKAWGNYYLLLFFLIRENPLNLCSSASYILRVAEMLSRSQYFDTAIEEA